MTVRLILISGDILVGVLDNVPMNVGGATGRASWPVWQVRFVV
jgi:hypothetical protein